MVRFLFPRTIVLSEDKRVMFVIEVGIGFISKSSNLSLRYSSNFTRRIFSFVLNPRGSY